MAREAIVRSTCDRCKKVIAEEAPVPKPAVVTTEKVPPTFILEVRNIQSDPVLATKGEVVQFDDLCTKCKSRLLDLVSQIRLDSKDGADAPDKSNETVDMAAKPKDNKGSKPAETKPASS